MNDTCLRCGTAYQANYRSAHASKTRVGVLSLFFLASTARVSPTFRNTDMLDAARNADDKKWVRRQCEIRKRARSGQKSKERARAHRKFSRVQLKMAARVTHRAVVCQLPEGNRSDSPGPSAGRQAREKRTCIRAIPDQWAELPVGPREKRMQRRRPGPSGAGPDV